MARAPQAHSKKTSSDGKLLGREEQMISAFSAAFGLARRIPRDRFGETTSFSRQSMAQLIQSHVEREAIERGAGNHGDGMIVQEEEELIGTAAMIDPGFSFQKWT